MSIPCEQGKLHGQSYNPAVVSFDLDCCPMTVQWARGVLVFRQRLCCCSADLYRMYYYIKVAKGQRHSALCPFAGPTIYINHCIYSSTRILHALLAPFLHIHTHTLHSIYSTPRATPSSPSHGFSTIFPLTSFSGLPAV